MEWFLVLVIVILADQASKRVAGTRVVSIHATYTEATFLVPPSSNPRLGFGLLGRRHLLFPAIAMAVLCGFTVSALIFPFNGPLYQAGMALAAGGALSNGMDLALRGATLDFIRIPRVTICNLADIAICAGASLMTASILQSA